MKYRELYEEYTTLLEDHTRFRLETASLPKGKLVKKQISGKQYYYLQYTSHGKKRTEYVKEAEVTEIQMRLDQGEKLNQRISALDEELTRLERAADILNETLSRTFSFLRQCADMDALPISKRNETLEFSNAMTALEGLPARKDTEEGLKAWSRGEKAFAEIYMPMLRRYHIWEADYEI